jgi:methylated-DNA-[protein]-cysteine S-methyltransferase
MTTDTGFALFETPIGVCGVAWSGRGLTRLQLPEANPAATERRLARSTGTNTPAAPPPAIAEAIAKVQSYLAGERVDFAGIAVDLGDPSPFNRHVYDAARALGWGETATYGEIARRIGAPGAARGVGQALGDNPVPVIIPCHRVLASGGKLGGFSAPGGAFAKTRLLELEGVGAGGALLPGLL